MAKIAADLEQALGRRREQGIAGGTQPRIVAKGEGWSVADVLCTCGPHDRPYEEQYARHTIAIVLTGSFQMRSSLGPALLTPGSLMLGNAGQSFECRHDHGEGDRCVSFWFTADYFERLAAEAAGTGAAPKRFRVPRLPPLGPLSALIARAGAALLNPAAPVPWAELSNDVAARAVQLASGASAHAVAWAPDAEARVARTIRTIDRYPDTGLTLEALARDARLSPYHFLRVFERVTGVTPHRYVLRARLREAATRLVAEPGKVLDIALECGFGDVSNFNRAFRAEFGESPRSFRRVT